MLEQEDLLSFVTAPSSKYSDKPLFPLAVLWLLSVNIWLKILAHREKELNGGETPNTVPNMWNSPTVEYMQRVLPGVRVRNARQVQNRFCKIIFPWNSTLCNDFSEQRKKNSELILMR